MQDFYNKALIGFIGLILVSCLVGYLCVDNTFLKISLLPVTKSDLPWRTEKNTDAHQGGQSALTIIDDRFSLNFDITMSRAATYPYAAFTLVFGEDTSNPDLVDLSRFDTLSFNVKCSAPNTLSFSMLTFDEKVSNKNDFLSYRAPSTFFSCDEDWHYVELDLTRLETAQWWFDMFNVDLSRKAYELDKVSKLSFGSSPQTPFGVKSNVHLSEIALVGHNWVCLYVLGGLLIIVWGGYAFWFFRQHTAALVDDLRTKFQRDRPLVAYQQLSVETHRDKDRSAILHFMATQYANPDVSLDTMTSSIGVSRTKINDILKSELGFTFTGYLNKLRLTEAARLLKEGEDANVAEIAYSVGYKNVSYFNKLFKEEYGCPPKAFKTLCEKTANPDA